MDFQNTVMAATVGLLTCPDQYLDDALARCDRVINSSALYSTDKPSVAIRSRAGITPLRDWVMRMRAGGPLACWPGFGGRDHGDIPAHIMAGFLGGRPGTLHVKHAGGCDLYHPGTISSPPHEMTVAQFADLINAQDNPEFYWPNILADINQFHRCNDIVEVGTDELTDFLLSNAAAHAWDVTGDEIMREVQVEALTFGKSFIIPAHLANLVEKVVPLFDSEPSVWLEAYDEDEVTGSDLYQLIMAQEFHGEIWQTCADLQQLAETLGEDYDLSEFPHIDAKQWGQYLQGLDALAAELVRDDLLELIRLECQRRRCEPMIPAALEEIFGPDEEERRRLSFRRHLQHDMGWNLKMQTVPWRMFVFDENGDKVEEANAATAIVDLQRRFEAALEAIEAFAVKVQSPFAVHFKLANRLAAHARVDAPFDREVFEHICVSNDAPDYLANMELVDLFAAFGWRTRRVLGLAAVAAADVFGAMGSWNDQSFDDDEDEQFEALSSQLFDAMNAYLASLLTVDPRVTSGTITPIQYLGRQLRRLLPWAD